MLPEWPVIAATVGMAVRRLVPQTEDFLQEEKNAGILASGVVLLELVAGGMI